MIHNLYPLNSRRSLEGILGCRVDELQRIAESPELYYREKVELRKGKVRRLLIPKYPLKLIQVRLCRRVFRHIPSHPAAFAVRGRGAVEAARRHLGNRWFYHRDIKDFYPSVTTDRVRERFMRLGASSEVADLLAGIVAVENQLPQGAPTSPAVGELVLYQLDTRIWNLIKGHRLEYTRYADDLTVSGGQHLRDRFVNKIDEIIIDCKWKLNEKGGLFGPEERHQMLGLKVNRQLGVPSEVFDRVRFVIKLAQKGIIPLTEREAASVLGTLSWIAESSPTRAEKLRSAVLALGSVSRTHELSGSASWRSVQG